MGLVPLLWLLRVVSPGRGAFLGFLYGLAYFGAHLFWIGMFGWFAWGGLTVSQAAYVGAFGLLAPVVRRPEHPVRSILGLAALWTVSEYVRGMFPLGGFTWGGLGVTQVDGRTLLPLASVAGAWGIAFVVVLVNALILDAIERGRGGGASGIGKAASHLGAAAVLLLAPAAIPWPTVQGDALQVAALQVDVRAWEHLDPAGEDLGIAAAHVDLHAELGEDPPDLVVWGESALDPWATRDAPTMADVASVVGEVGVPTVIGAIVDDPDGEIRNVNLVYDRTGRLADRYAKAHLVPFGEFVPWRRALGWIEALEQIPYDKAPGPTPRPVEVDGLRFGSVICFENIFPSLDRRLVAQDAAFLVVTTNNASYGFSPASRQHLAQSRLRAVENGRWVVHAAISGISAFVDPQGRVSQETDLFEQTILRGTIRASESRTPYVRLGDWVPWASAALLVGLFLAPRTRAVAPRPRAPLSERPRTLVILPTYEERATIAEITERLLALPSRLDVLVVDDGSPDGTGEIVRSLTTRHGGRLRLHERPGERGLAGAYATGFRMGIEEGYDLVVEMDADLSHDPEELPRLLEGAREHDLTIGSRYVPGGAVTNWGRARRALSRAGNLYARLALGLPVTDATSGFRVYRRELLAHLLEPPPTAEGYGFQIELALRAWRDAFSVGERPITFRERYHGRSKLSRRIVFEAMWLVTVWGLRDRLSPAP